MVIESPPASPKYRAAFAEKVIGHSKPRLPEQRSHRESCYRNSRIAAVPVESTEGRSGCASCIAVLRRIKDRVPEALTVGPRIEMGHAKPKLQSKFRVHLPGILNEALVGVIRDIVDPVEIRFLILRHVAGQ